MNNFLKSLKSTEFSISDNAEISLDDEMTALVAGGVDPEEVDAEAEQTNILCIVIRF